MQRETKTMLVATMFAWIPYAAVAWGYKALTDGDAKSFWYALAALIALRLFFGVIETLGDILLWRMYGKRTTVKEYLDILQNNKMPQREYAESDLDDYLHRIQEEAKYPDPIRKVAREVEWALRALERVGFLTGRRVRSAAIEAYDRYSPKSAAPPYDGSSAAKHDALFDS